jgi:hypothetical protein
MILIKFFSLLLFYLIAVIYSLYLVFGSIFYFIRDIVYIFTPQAFVIEIIGQSIFNFLFGIVLFCLICAFWTNSVLSPRLIIGKSKLPIGRKWK